ncbi:hypothetical protein C2E23DRAFT_709022, partial [Lenzites betulinus]
YRETGRWQNYPRGARVAADGEATRILGAYIGNKVNAKDIWEKRVAKIEGTMRKWAESRTTVKGKRHAIQMVLGSMTQFLTEVQRMPEGVAEELGKMARDYVWDEKAHVPIAMDYLHMPLAKGGL